MSTSSSAMRSSSSIAAAISSLPFRLVSRSAAIRRVLAVAALRFRWRRSGFSVEVDGVLGPRTKQALITFQRRQGLQASGEIDVRTKTALGMSNNERGGAATTGQGGSDRQSGPGDQGRGSGADQ